MASARSALRGLLRVLDQKVTRTNNERIWRDHVIAEFRRNAGETNPAKIQALLSQVDDYTFLANSVHRQKDLLVSYNIATNKQKQQIQSLQATAARVGLRLPEHYDPGAV
mmetsp:Transcript_27190/g.87235  ORF Transcript_27190/g.87235 Transcript_27190/m.87235 type:complete len:110 (-) Transcript_27190:32-361(-)